MSFFKVIFVCALLVLQCLAQDPLDLDPNNDWPLGREPANPDSQPPITLAQLYRELRSQPSEWIDWQLQRMITAAVDGDEFYKLEVDLSDRHRRTAQIVMKMLQQFRTQRETLTSLDEVRADTVATIGNGSDHLRHPLEELFDRLDRRLRANSNLSTRYSRLQADSRNSPLTSHRKRYFTRVVDIGSGYFPMKPNFMAIPGNLRMMLVVGFQEKLEYKSRTTFEQYALANAIYRLGRTDEYEDQVERIRDAVTSEVVPLMLEQKLVPFFFDYDVFVDEMLRRLERSLNQRADLKLRLTKEKQAIESENPIENSVGSDSFENIMSRFITKIRKITSK